MALSTIVGSLELGSIFALMSLGLFIAFRILDLPDLTVDGSFVTGVACSAILTEAGHPFLGLFLGTVGGALAGVMTGVLHTKLKIHAILAGILTMTSLYSINLWIMQERPSIFFYEAKTMFSGVQGKLIIAGVDFGSFLLLLILAALAAAILYFFLKTQLGMSLRATGDNEAMVRSSSINTDAMKILGFALCNGLVALAGAVYAQYTKTGTFTVGTGMLVLGLASIIVGEALFYHHKSMGLHLLAVILGAILYRLMLTFAFQLGLPASDLKLFSAAIVILAIAIPVVQEAQKKRRQRHAAD